MSKKKNRILLEWVYDELCCAIGLTVEGDSALALSCLESIRENLESSLPGFVKSRSEDASEEARWAAKKAAKAERERKEEEARRLSEVFVGPISSNGFKREDSLVWQKEKKK